MMSPLNRGPLMGPRMPPACMRPPPPRFGRPPMPGMGPRMPPMPMPPMGGMFGPMRQRMPPPRPGPMMRPGGPQPLFGPRSRGPLPLMLPMMGPRGMGPRGPLMRPGPRGIMPPQGLPHMRPRFPPGNGNIKGKNVNNAKKVNKLEEIELKKPWMTDEIRSEIQKKNKLYAKAKKNKDAKEWEEFKDLRNKVTRMIRDAKNEYFAKNPEQASLYRDEAEYDDIRDENYTSGEEENTTYYCELCDREYFTQQSLDKHLQEHRVCGIDGCTFSAHTKIVEKHILMQHCTGLYDKMKNLKTPEDIQNWIAERKRKYPKKLTTDQNEAENLEKLEHKENIYETDKLSSSTSKNDNQKSIRERKTRRGKKRRTNIKMKKIPLNDVVELYRGIPPFKGTKYLDEEFEEAISKSDDEEEEICPLSNKISDDEEEQPFIPIKYTKETNEIIPQSEIINNNPSVEASVLNSLTMLANYSSDSDDEGPDECPITIMKDISPDELEKVGNVSEKKIEGECSSKRQRSQLTESFNNEDIETPINCEYKKPRIDSSQHSSEAHIQ